MDDIMIWAIIFEGVLLITFYRVIYNLKHEKKELKDEKLDLGASLASVRFNLARALDGRQTFKNLTRNLEMDQKQLNAKLMLSNKQARKKEAESNRVIKYMNRELNRRLDKYRVTEGQRNEFKRLYLESSHELRLESSHTNNLEEQGLNYKMKALEDKLYAVITDRDKYKALYLPWHKECSSVKKTVDEQTVDIEGLRSEQRSIAASRNYYKGRHAKALKDIKALEALVRVKDKEISELNNN